MIRRQTWRQLQPILSSEWADWSPVYAWAIEHPEGVIVVDTGAAAYLKSLPRWHPYFRFAVRFDGGQKVPREFSIDIDEPYELGGSNRSAEFAGTLASSAQRLHDGGLRGAVRGARNHPRKT